MAAQPIGNLATETVVTIMEDDGQLHNYVVMRQGPYTGTGFYDWENSYEGLENVTLLLRQDCPVKGVFGTDSGLVEYSTSEVESWTTNTFYPIIAAELGSVLKEITVPYYYARAYSDSTRRYLKTYTGSVFNVAYNELRILWGDSSANRIANYDGDAIQYITRDGDEFSSNAVRVQGIGTTGSYNNLHASYNSYGYRPVIAVDSVNTWVTEEGQVVANTPPAITGTDGDLGTFGETSPTYAYTVTDQQGGTVSVTEALDGETLRTYTVTLGQQNTLTIPAATYLTTLNGTHTLTITATDSVGAQTVRTMTFTKDVTSCAFTQTAAFTVDDMPTRCVVNIQGAFPEGSVLTVQICNNGNDASPTWETITQQALLGQKYFFQNETKTAAEWGVKVQASLSRGTAEGDCYISSIGGVFQ